MVGSRTIRTEAELDALPVGSVLCLRTACAAARRTRRGWQATGLAMSPADVRTALIVTLPHWVLDVPSEALRAGTGC